MKYFLVIIFCCFSIFSFIEAKTDLSISVSDITFSKSEPLEGDLVRVFARVFNLGESDVYGFVIFISNGKEITDPQPISVKANTYDDVFIDWIVDAGVHNIESQIINTNPPDDISENNTAKKEKYFVDLDTDKDKIGNKKDPDDDGDGISDKDELLLGTNSLKIDTDDDTIGDKYDTFPLDINESEDTDGDGIGNNADSDNDNDGLDNNKESILGTDPFDADSDNDNINDLDDFYPLDPKKFKKTPISFKKMQATIISVDDFSPRNLMILHVITFIIIIIFFLYRRRKL